ncbi:MAG: hypothetical protein KAR42_03025 [candidate division Zixibacteria bacterium]|nr:hypothetical protein [candidate division Zixibacteria bacterium]
MKFLNVIIVLSIALLLFSCGEDSSTNPDDPNGGDPTSNALVPVSTFILPDNARALAILLDYPYIYTAGYGCYLGIIDISDPANTSLKGSISTGPSSSGGWPYGDNPIAKRGNYVFVAYQTSWNTPDSLIVFNVANPSSPTIYAVLQSAKFPHDSRYFNFENIYILDTALYELRQHLREYSISHLPNFQIVDTILNNDLSYDVLGCMGIYSDYLYCAGNTNDHRLLTIDRHTRLLKGYIDLPNDVGYRRMELAYPKAFIWDQNYQGSSDFGNLVVEVNLSNATSPTVVRTFDAFPQYEVDSTTYPFTLNDIAVGSDFLALGGSNRSLLICDFDMQLIKATIPGSGDFGEDNWAIQVSDSMIYALSTRQLSVFQYSD